MIFVHGGSWYAGDKSDWSTAHADLFLENDIINVSVNYGLTPHPTQINDVAKAVRWVYDNIDKYGGDRSRIYLMGFSAGAHLVSLLCTDESYLKEQNLELKNISGVCSYDGGNYMRQAESIVGSSIEADIRRNFGDDIDMWRKALPYYYIKQGKNIPPFLLVAERDVDYRLESNITFARKLSDNGYSVDEVYLSGCNHWEIFYKKIFEKTTKERILDFIK